MEVKGINWVGHIYHKYESMLLEVEEDIYQDVLYQVQTVGDSVKKFYSDVIQDLLPPPSSDSLKTRDSDLSVEKYADVCACKKIKVATKEEPVNVKALRVMEIPKVIDMETEDHATADSLSGSCSELYSTAYEDASMHDYSNHDMKMNSERENISTWKGYSGSGSFEHLHDNHEAPSDEIAGNISRCDEIEDQSKYESFVSVDGPSKSMLEQSIDDQDSRTIQPKETCVMVNGDEVHFAPPRKGKGRPSKKKIRDELSLRMKPTRMQEYEQVAVWYGGDAGSERLKPVPSMEDKTSSATSSACESEWELL